MWTFNNTTTAVDLFQQFLNEALGFEDLVCIESKLSPYSENVTDDELREESNLCDLLMYTYIFVLPTSLALAIPGNVATILTVKTMSNSPATFYMALMAAGDLAAVVVKMISHILMKELSFGINLSILWFHATAVDVPIFPNWVLVLTCLERFFAVRFPLKKKVLFTMKNVKLSAIGLAAVLFLLCLLRVGQYAGNWAQWEEVMIYLFTCAQTVVPLVLVLTLTCATILALVQHRKWREDMTIPTVANRNPPATTASEKSLTIMMVTAATVFFMFTLPFTLMPILIFHYEFTPDFSMTRYVIAFQVAECLYNLTHVINGYLYFILAPKFRQQFISLLTCRINRT